MRARCLEHPDRPEDVDVTVEDGLLDRPAHVGLRRKMEADVRLPFPKGLPEHARVTDVPDDQLGSVVQALALAGDEAVDHDHIVATRDESVDEVRPDEAHAACDNRPHLLVS